MLRTPRRLSSALVFATLLSLPVQPAAAAASANPAGSSVSRSVDRLWSWLEELWGGPRKAAVERPAAGGRRPSALIGKLGGFLDPDGATKLAPSPGTTSN